MYSTCSFKFKSKLIRKHERLTTCAIQNHRKPWVVDLWSSMINLLRLPLLRHTVDFAFSTVWFYENCNLWPQKLIHLSSFDSKIAIVPSIWLKRLIIFKIWKKKVNNVLFFLPSGHSARLKWWNGVDWNGREKTAKKKYIFHIAWWFLL